MEVWEVLYHHLVLLFLQQCDFSANVFIHYISERVDSSFLFNTQDECYRNLQQLLAEVKERCTTFDANFEAFLDSQAAKDPTWRFWQQFVYTDGMAYIGLLEFKNGFY